jgi:hypothetical protein
MAVFWPHYTLSGARAIPWLAHALRDCFHTDLMVSEFIVTMSNQSDCCTSQGTYFEATPIHPRVGQGNPSFSKVSKVRLR